MSARRHAAPPTGRVVALSGGVGGAKLAAGLYQVLGSALHVVVNTGDDFTHMGLHISPDIDSVMYGLSGLNDLERGWGRAGESWHFMEELERLGGDTWFRLGDRDLAMHVVRSKALAQGDTLSDVTTALARWLGITAQIMPMSNDAVHTRLHTDVGTLDFQDYFVRRQCAPAVRAIEYVGAALAGATVPVAAALRPEGLEAVILCPSNPYLSIDPILAIADILQAIRAANAPVVAVSPLIQGKALKGPAARLMQELDGQEGNRGIVCKYDGLIDGLIVDHRDAHEAESLGIPVRVTSTLMTSDHDRAKLADECLAFARELKGSRHAG